MKMKLKFRTNKLKDGAAQKLKFKGDQELDLIVHIILVNIAMFSLEAAPSTDSSTGDPHLHPLNIKSN